MKIYGYKNSDSVNLINLKEVTFQCDSREARIAAEYFLYCSIEMDSKVGWEHLHLKDFLSDENCYADVIVYKD